MCIKLAKISEKFLDFEVEKEVWNRYELIEGAQLKARVILMKTLERKGHADPKKNQFGIESKNIVSIVPMKSFQLLRTGESKEFSQKDLREAKRIEVSFDQVSEDWNVYRLEDGRRLKVKLVITNISRMKGLYDKAGIPLYDIGSTVVFNVGPKK